MSDLEELARFDNKILIILLRYGVNWEQFIRFNSRFSKELWKREEKLKRQDDRLKVLRKESATPWEVATALKIVKKVLD